MRRTYFVLIALSCLALTGRVSASTFLSAEFREVVAGASVIVRGRVADVRAIRSASGDIESAVTIAVETSLKGSSEAFVSMRLPGGTVGRYRTVMVGAPVMQVGERAVFFLKPGPGNTLWPVGLSQGIYRIALTGVGRPLGLVHAPVVPGVTTNASGPVIRGDVRRKSLPVSEFESLVRLLLTRRVS